VSATFALSTNGTYGMLTRAGEKDIRDTQTPARGARQNRRSVRDERTTKSGACTRERD
jgi:hypothetical protein